MPVQVYCRVCRSARTRYLCDTPNEHSKTSRLSHYRCRDCGSVFVGNDIQPDELEAAYKTLDMELYYAEIERENRRKMRSALHDLHVAKDSRILDVGTGDGQFVRMLKHAGFERVSAHEIEGADLSEVSSLAENIYQDFDYSAIPSDHFDVVTLLDVAEHVPDPTQLIRECYRILRRGGFVYIHTPVVTRTDRLMHRIQRLPLASQLGRAWQRARTSVFHLQNYTRSSLTPLLHNAGFVDIDIRVCNELSWPVRRYVSVYLLDKHGLPRILSWPLTPFVYPLIASNLMNPNKAIVRAYKR